MGVDLSRLICFVEVTGSHTNDVKVLQEIAVLMELSLAIEKAFDNERSIKFCCNQLWNF